MTEVVPGKLSIGQMIALSETAKKTRSHAAQWFVDHEIAILPLQGKLPVTKNGVLDAKVSMQGITGNYGIALGKGLIGVDFDEYDGASGFELFPKTRRWRSGSGKGFGLLYKVPEEYSRYTFKIAPGITVRGEHSYLVGPESVHPGTPKKNIPAGGTYDLIDDVEIEEAPQWLTEYLKQRATQAEKAEYFVGESVKPEWMFTDQAWVKKFSIEEASDRSQATYDIAAYSIERGASDQEISWIIRNFKPALDKDQVDKEIERLISKLRPKHTHPDFACDEVGCENTPDWMSKQVTVAFWNERPEFEYIKQAAQSRLVSPKAVMIAVLCRLAAAIPTEFVLPPIVGKRASLNFFACFVGEAGGGKGTATGLAEELFNFRQTGVQITTSTPGSGEGVVSTYLKIKDNKWTQVHESALINFDEIDNLKASSDRQGSTLSAILRQAFMGEQIGGTYSRAVKELLPHSYRMALQLSAQPLRSAGLLEDSDGGLPQRFVFVQTTNPECPDVDDLPEFPAFRKWSPPQLVLDLKNRKEEAKKPNEVLGKLDHESEIEKQYVELIVGPEIERELKINRIQRLKTGKTGNEGHSDLVRLKVAALLAILDGRIDINVKDWKLSLTIMRWSKQAVNEIEEALTHKKLKEEQTRTTAAIKRSVTIEKAIENKDVEKVAENLLNWMNKGVNDITGRGSLSQRIRRDKNHLIEDAIELLIKEKKAQRTHDGKKLELVK